MIPLIEYLVQHIGFCQQVKFRQAFYANVLSLTQAQLKKNGDIALTINLHPASLGVKSECDGRICIPESVKISALIAENLYEVAQGPTGGIAALNIRFFFVRHAFPKSVQINLLGCTLYSL